MKIDFDTDLKRDIEDLERTLEKLELNDGWKFWTPDMEDARKQIKGGLEQLRWCFSESLQERGAN